MPELLRVPPPHTQGHPLAPSQERRARTRPPQILRFVNTKTYWFTVIVALLISHSIPSLAQSQITCLPAPSGIVAWWSLDETSGTVVTDRVGNNSGALINAPVPASGEVRGALLFDGANYATVPDSDLWAFGTGNFSIELWANFDRPGSGSLGEPGNIFIGNDEGPFNRNKWFFALGGGFLNFHINSPTLGPKFFPLVPFAPNPGQWYHLAVVRRGSTYTIYVNGVPGGSADSTDPIPNAGAPLTIGQAENIGFMTGRLDEIAIYNRALTPEELLAIYNAGSAGKCIDISIRPAKGGNTGSISVHVNGVGFSADTDLKLSRSGFPDIPASSVQVGAHGTSLDARLDLTDMPQGEWDVVATNANSTSLALAKGFTIEQGVGPQLWVDIVGLGLMRPGRPQTYALLVGNRGNTDARGAFVSVALPNWLTWTVNKDQPLFGTSVTDTDSILTFAVGGIPSGGQRVVQLTLEAPNLAHQSFTLRVRQLPFDSSALATNAVSVASSGLVDSLPSVPQLYFFSPNLYDACPDVRALTVPICPSCGYANFLASRLAAVDALRDVWQAQLEVLDVSQEILADVGKALLVGAAIELIADAIILEAGIEGVTLGYNLGEQIQIGLTIVHDLWQAALDRDASEVTVAGGDYVTWLAQYSAAHNQIVNKLDIVKNRKLIDLFGRINANINTAASAVQSVIAHVDALRKAVDDLTGADSHFAITDGLLCGVLRNYVTCVGGSNSCRTLPPTEPVVPDLGDNGSDDATKNGGIIGSFDPNDKVGSQGTGPSHFLSGQEPLRYSIFFQNVETATAPAQEVVITDQLDTATVDISTVSLGPISFGDRIVTPPPGLSMFSTDVDLRPERNLIVRIAAGVNPNSGLVTWRLTSIDPATGDLPSDPQAGFLPPDGKPPEGEGSVLFTVIPRRVLSSGTAIRNVATIRFDTNIPIDTPGWMNTLDNTKPESHVLALAPTQGSPSFVVRWAGTDTGSGVRDFTIYVSDNGGAFTPFVVNTSQAEAIFNGFPGHTYSFFANARDFAGNVEEIHPGADTTTIVVGDGIPRNTVGDFDADGKRDLAIYRQSSGDWFVFGTATGFQTRTFGAPAASGLGDIPVPRDFDGDGKADLAIYRQSTGEWFIFGSATGFQTRTFGAPAASGLGDIPVPDDFDGDGKADLAIYRQSTGDWFISGSATGFQTRTFGAPAATGLGDIPVPGDFDGDGKVDLAIYRQSTGDWFIFGTATGFQTRTFGAPVATGFGDVPVPGDFDGDGKADLAIYRQSTGDWFVFGSATGFQTRTFGAPAATDLGDIPVPGAH